MSDTRFDEGYSGKGSRWVAVGSASVELTKALWTKLAESSLVFHIHFSSQHGRVVTEPILLKGHTMEQFKDLLSAVITQFTTTRSADLTCQQAIVNRGVGAEISMLGASDMDNGGNQDTLGAQSPSQFPLSDPSTFT
ncbi:hypothetical protein VNI00_011245 [Paramarasmius palmivorus]|uniref:Uncharacterized protein n=1 Tax=Paramarasmius palmivorus TaxID=297713 RepID=A0AAW0CFM9_9AGAR